MSSFSVKNKKISVLGMARSGKALAEALIGLGASVLISEVKSNGEMEAVKNELAHLPLEWETGGHTDRIYKGRDLVVISPGVSIYTPVLIEAKQAGVPVVSELEIAFLLARSPFVAITGTNGKSTTSTMIHQALLNDGRKSYLAGNIGIPLIGEVGKIEPEAWITAEVSSFQLEAVDKFKPHVAVLTNITSDHIDRHGSFDAYVMAKANLFRKQDADDFAVLNADNPAVMSIDGLVPSRKLYFSRKKPVQQGAYYENGYVKVQFRDFLDRHYLKWEDMPLRGVHNLENTLALVCVCTALGVSRKAVIKTLMEFKNLHYRMEYVDTINGISFYNDSKGTNPDAVRASLESLNVPVVIIAGGTDKNLDFYPLAEKIKELTVHAVLIGQSRMKIKEALEKAGSNSFTVVDDLSLEGFKKAIKVAFNLCPKGGAVLLSPSCASFDMFRNAEHRGEMFDFYVREMKRENEEKI